MDNVQNYNSYIKNTMCLGLSVIAIYLCNFFIGPGDWEFRTYYILHCYCQRPCFKEHKRVNFEFINRKQKVKKSDTVWGKEYFILKVLI
jgi:hypothetical protein